MSSSSPRGFYKSSLQRTEDKTQRGSSRITHMRAHTMNTNAGKLNVSRQLPWRNLFPEC